MPISFTEEDFEQVAAGNFVVKVIYLPDPQFQDLASTGPDEVVSSRLEPGVDPIAEAHRRGSILLVVRLGNIDLEAPNTPAMDAPSPYQQKVMLPPAMMMGNGMMPPGMMPPGMMTAGCLRAWCRPGDDASRHDAPRPRCAPASPRRRPALAAAGPPRESTPAKSADSTPAKAPALLAALGGRPDLQGRRLSCPMR